MESSVQIYSEEENGWKIWEGQVVSAIKKMSGSNARTKVNVISPHSSVGRALDLKTQGCGFDSWASQPNIYKLSFQ